MRLSIVLFSVFLTLLPAASAQELPESFVVDKATLEGIHQVPERALRATLAANPVDFWKFWEPETALTPGELEDDRHRIRQFYRVRGYYETRVEIRTQFTGRTARRIADGVLGPLPAIRVVFQVEEGPPVLVEDIQIQRPEEGPGTDEILGWIPLKRGQVFVEEEYRTAKKRLARLYGNRGFPFAQVDGQVRVDVREHKARVLLTIEPGQRYRFGTTTIVQEEGVVREKILHRALKIEPGESYRSEAVEESQRNLYRMDVFGSVSIRPGDPEPGSDRLPMEVRLKAKKRQQVGLGIGYGSEDGLRLRGEWAYRNVLETGGRVGLSAKRTDLLQNIQAQHFQPYFWDDRTDLRSRAGWERETLESYTNRKLFVNLAAGRNLAPDWTGTLGYKLERNQLEEVNLTDPFELAEFVRNNQYLVSSVDIGLVWSTVDNLIYPKEGLSVALSSEQALPLLGSELSYVSPSVEVKAFTTPLSWLTLAGRLHLQSIGGVGATDYIPIFKRLFLGGSNTVRGYGYQKVGPLDGNGNPVGGQSAANGNLEARFPIYRDFSGLLFLDAGLVDLQAYHWDTGRIQYSCGTGVRYNTLIGPLRVEFGYKINPPDPAAPGGEEDRWRVHFSIGQTF